jgi:hypothetical protein
MATIPAADLVQLVMRKLGVTGDTAFAKKLGLTGYEAPKDVKRWRTGESGPRYDVTMLMLDMAGLLVDDVYAQIKPRDPRTREEARAQLVDAARQIARVTHWLEEQERSPDVEAPVQVRKRPA